MAAKNQSSRRQSMLSGNPIGSWPGRPVVVCRRVRCSGCDAMRWRCFDNRPQLSRNGTARQGGRSTRFELGLSTAKVRSQSPGWEMSRSGQVMGRYGREIVMRWAGISIAGGRVGGIGEWNGLALTLAGALARVARVGGRMSGLAGSSGQQGRWGHLGWGWDAWDG